MIKLKKVTIAILIHLALISCSGNDEVTICISRSSHAYHSKRCRGVKACTHELKKVTIEEARQMGRTACGYCY